MQLEALQLLRNQHEQGFEAGTTHEDIETKLAGYRPLRLRLTHDGLIHSLSPYSAEDAPGYWSLKSGPAAKKKRFPALRLLPLTKLDSNAPEWEALLETIARKKPSDSAFSEVAEFLERQCRSGERNAPELQEAWDEKAAPLLEQLGHEEDPAGARLLRLINAFGAFSGCLKSEVADKPASADPEEQLIAAALTWLGGISETVDLETAVQLIVGKRRKGKDLVLDSVQLCFDLYDPDDPIATIYTARTRSIVVHALPRSREQGRCALSGKSGPLLTTRFPIWTGKLAIYSKNPDAACNFRYGQAGLNAFPILEDVARAITGGLSQMIHKSRQGKTWTLICNGKGQRSEKGRGWKEGRDWLLAYPSFNARELRTVDIFQEPTGGVGSRKRFEDLAEALCARLASRDTSQGVPAYLQVLLIREVSAGQVQQVFADDTPVARLVEAVTAWRADNLPPSLRIPIPSRLKAMNWFRPRALFPEQVARLLTHQWMRAGTESSRVEGPSIGSIFELFLRKPGIWEENAAQLLDLTLARTAPLLRGVGQLLHLNPRAVNKEWDSAWLKLFPTAADGTSDWKKPQPGRSFVDSLSLIGSLLYAMNSPVDEYTNESAYLLGRLLAMMDELHRCYCVAVRDGSLPPTLIGNGLLGRAAEAPALAIEELLDRSRIYLGWAKTAEPPTGHKKDRERDAVLSAKEVLLLAGPLSERLHAASSLDEELSAVRKAHLFLGYLSPVLGAPEARTGSGKDAGHETGASTRGVK